MEIVVIILSLLVVFLLYKISLLNKHITVLSFSQKNINKLLINKKVILPEEIERIVNESIGNMYAEEGKKIIKSAKSLGINIPEYMDDEKLNEYIKSQELKRMEREIPLTDRMLMDN